MRRLAAIRDAGGRLQEIVLAPLRLEDVGRLIADALQCAPDRAEPLSQLVHEKTGGNPFFTIQFLTALAEQGLIAVDHGAARWTWDLEHIHAKDYTDNVVNLMLGKLRRLPAETQKAMQQLACLGNTAPISTLAMVRGGSEEALHAELWTAICAGLVSRQEGTYQFLHDRIQEAAYALTPKEERVAQHLGIGRLLAAHTEPEKQEEAIFEIVNQLNRGTALITSRDEREQLAELNLLAGKRAKASSAYDSALKYLIAATALLADDRWERRRDLAFPLELQRAECEFLTGELAAADERLTTLSSCTANTVERATVACLRIDVCTTLDQSDRAIAVALDYLRHGDIHWSPHPTAEEARREYEQIWSRLGSHTIEDLIDLPLMNDPEALATVDVLTKVLPPALFTNANLVSLTICRAVNLSLELGNCDASCFAYVMLGRIAGARFGDYKAGFRFGQLGYDLVERRGLKRFHASTYLIFAIVTTWMKHVRFSCDLLRQAFEAANRSGDLTYAAYACNNLNSALLFKGDPLAEVHREAEHGLAFAQRAGFGLVTDIITTQIALVRTLRGLTPEFGCLDGEHLEEFRFEQHLSDNPVRAIAEFRYWIRKLEARYLAGRYVAAVQASLRAQRLLWTGALSFEEAEYHFYDALLRAACCEGASASERRQHLQSLVAHHRRLAVWADNCPENFENRVALVAAEIARVEGRDFEAMRFYEQAVRSARSNGFIHCEALASELAARFYMARDFDKIAHTYLRTARDCYLQWGADGKVRQLEQLHPYLREEKSLPEPTSTIVAPVEHLDLATVIKVSQAVSSEVILETLIDKLMRVAMEHAGAERGLLILSRGAEPRIVAKAKIDGDTVAVDLCDDPVTAAVLPEAILHHVLRARESIILDDAAAQNPFSADSYIHQREARSIFCLPLIAQAKLVGALYLENNLTARVFASARIAVLKLLASQAAIALENARLYRDLAEREAKIRRLVDANLIGIFIWGLQGQIIEANDTFLRMVGYDHEDLAAGRVRWTDLAPPQWLGRTAGAPEEIDTRGAAQAYEKEYLRKDGSRVPVLIGSTAFDEARDEGVTFVLDLTERKRAEAAAREVQLELAHANRVATMGQLSASIAHEINQPIGAAITYAQAGLSWLRAKPPNLEEALHALNLIVESSVRTAEVIDRIRALFKKAPTRNERLDINDGIREVIELTRGEAVKHDVSVQTDLADSLPLIYGDRVQLQQVILNLIMNAVEAMSGASDGKRELLISTRKADLQGVLVGVRDSGPGLAPEALERLFDAFYTTKPGGLGLGLSICRSIIEAHGGRLWANANVPHGAIFEFTVPAYPDITS